MRLFLVIAISLLAIIPNFAQTRGTVQAFFNQPFATEENVDNLSTYSGIKFKVKKEPVVNIHEPSVVDTVYHFKKCKNHIWLYKSAYNTIVYKATLSSKKAKLAFGIRPGMKREEFYKAIINLKATGAAVHTFSNNDKSASATVTFKRDKLKTISFEYGLD
ncbi:hypothetical protein BH09BAC1_BH09BAC1_27860 [soil metagenome]